MPGSKLEINELITNYFLQLLPLPQLLVPLQDAVPLQEAHGAALTPQPVGSEPQQEPQPEANTAAAATARAKPNLFITNIPLSSIN
ncbi:MAG: hypothetical protein M3R00_08740 [Pseudomonadota bacterium]|nr:hypothetical protein [Pseudomonadota bacterium]